MHVKVISVRCVEYRGAFEHEGEFWEERLSHPVDVYPKFSAQPPVPIERAPDGRAVVRLMFVHVDTDEGIVGTAGPVSEAQAMLAMDLSAPALIGADPLATEQTWDILYRYAPHGRKGLGMMAISALDCALWDIKGQYFRAPVHVLLGGPTREQIPVYASTLGFSLNLESAARTAKKLAQMGFRAQKWFPRYGPSDGDVGFDRNVSVIGAVREAVGPDVELMVDAWMSWDVPYTLRIARAFADLGVRWVEEPLKPDEVESYLELRRRIDDRVLVAGGEHEYTRWGAYEVLRRHAVDVYQADTLWAGGISEMTKIASLASIFGVPVIPHGESFPANAQFSFAQPPWLTPTLEHLVKWNALRQYFLKYPVQPVSGLVVAPTCYGLGMELDDTKIESRRELRSVA